MCGHDTNIKKILKYSVFLFSTYLEAKIFEKLKILIPIITKFLNHNVKYHAQIIQKPTINEFYFYKHIIAYTYSMFGIEMTTY